MSSNLLEDGGISRFIRRRKRLPNGGMLFLFEIPLWDGLSVFHASIHRLCCNREQLYIGYSGSPNNAIANAVNWWRENGPRSAHAHAEISDLFTGGAG